MDYKESWEAIGKFFYSTNFSLLISALIIWDYGLFKILPNFIGCLTNLNLEASLFINTITIISTIALLIYFILDWIDATMVSKIDSNIRILDIVFWLLIPILLSFTIVLLIKSQVIALWLYSCLSFYLFYNGSILIKRDNRINIEKDKIWTEKDNKGKEQYDALSKFENNQKWLGYTFLVISVLTFISLFFPSVKNFFKNQDLVELKLIILHFIILTSIIINIYLKFRQHKLFMLPIYQKGAN